MNFPTILYYQARKSVNGKEQCAKLLLLASLLLVGLQFQKEETGTPFAEANTAGTRTR
jgi:hypothetical protein